MLKSGALIVSVVFHPLLVVTYMVMIILLINPYIFGFNTLQEGTLLLIQIFLSTVVIPVFGTMMFKLLGFIDSFEMKERQERIGPYILTATFYMWLLINFIKSPNVPREITVLILGAVIALFVSFFINNFIKVSAHTVGMGSLIGMTVISMQTMTFDSLVLDLPALGIQYLSSYNILLIFIIIAGLVGSSRLLLKAHQPSEIYIGYAVGLISQGIAAAYLLS